MSNHLLNGQRTPIEDNMRRDTRNWSNTIFVSASYKSLKLTYNGQIISSQKSRSQSTGTLGSFTNEYKMLSPVNYQNIAMRYSAPLGMTLGGDYTLYSENRSQSLFKGADYLIGSDNRQRINRYHAYIDRERDIDKWQLNYGAEYQHSADNSSQIYASSAKPDFDDTYREDVAGFYIGAQRSFDWGLSFNASAKGEYYHSKYQHNWNFIPQLGATYVGSPKASSS